MTSGSRGGLSPEDDSWVAAIYEDANDQSPRGSGFLLDANRVLTCAHVVCKDRVPRDGLWVAFPKSEQLMHRRVLVERVVVSDGRRQHLDDVAVLILNEALPVEMAARVRCPAPADLIGQPWWSFGFPDGDELGDSSHGQVGEALSYGWVRLDTNSVSLVKQGYSGAALWSESYRAVVGLIGQANEVGNARALTLWQVDRCLPDEKIARRAHWSAEAAGESALAAWGWSLAADPEAGRHWLPRARGVSNVAELGYRFHGRKTALTQVISFITAEAATRRPLIVTGSPGVGKSALLGRIVTSADPEIALELPAYDVAMRAPVGSVACAVHAKGKSALEIACEIARAASAAIPREAMDLAPALRVALADRRFAQFAVVIDALDEAASPEDARLVARQVVRPMVENCADLGVRVVVGTRRYDGAGDLLPVFGPAAAIVDLDDPQYFAQGDLEAYALSSLQLLGAERAESPYVSEVAARPVADRIAELSKRNFLVAGLIARAHGLHDDQAIDPSLIAFTPTVDAALAEYLERISPVGERSALELLTALAYAEAPGFSVDLWRIAIISLYGSAPSEERLDAFAHSSAANFVVESSSAEREIGNVFRLFHQALNDALLAWRSQEIADERAIANSFMACGRSRGWRDSPSYLLRALPRHAVRGGLVDDLLGESEYLLYADVRRVIFAAAGGRLALNQDRLRLLRKTPRAIDADPANRTALWSVTEAQEQLGTSYTASHLATPYRALWAHTVPQDVETVFEGHTAPVNAVCAVSLDDCRVLLASGDDDGVIRLWDPVTGELIQIFHRHNARINALCVLRTADGRVLLASAGDDARICVWDLITGELISFFPSFRNRPKFRTLAALPLRGEKAELASGDDDGGVTVWDPLTGSWLHTLATSARGISAMCQLPGDGGTDLACSDDDGTVRVWDPVERKSVLIPDVSPRRINTMCAVELSGLTLLVTDAGRAVKLWDPRTGGVHRTLGGPDDWINAVCAVPQSDGLNCIASAGSSTTVRLWDPQRGVLVRALQGHQREVRAICTVHAPDGRTLIATGSADKTVRLWDPAPRTLPDTVAGHHGIVTTASLVQIGGAVLLATGGDDTTVRLWDPLTGGAKAVLEGHTDCIRAVCSITAGTGATMLASAGHDKRVHLWNAATAEKAFSFPECTDKIGAMCTVALRRGVQLLATGHDDATVQLWDPRTGRQMRTLRGHTGPINALCELQYPDGTVLLASGGDDKTVRLWDPSIGGAAEILRGHTAWVRAVCSIPLRDGRTLLASGSTDSTVRLWDPMSGQALHILTGHTDEVYALCVVRVADRAFLASGGDDRAVRLWDLESLREVLEIPARHQVRALTAIDGRLFVAMTDGTMALVIDPALGTTSHRSSPL